MYKYKSLLMASLMGAMIYPTYAAELEVSHWWVSAGEANAIQAIADEFNAKTEHTWKDNAIARGKELFISRIASGSPMGVVQLNHGRDAEELIQSGYMQDLAEVAERENWADIIYPKSLLDSCTYEGKVYCAPVNIHSWQWLWLSNDAFAAAGIPVPTNWDALAAAAPALRAKGIVPLGVGSQSWQVGGMADVLLMSSLGKTDWEKLFGNKDVSIARGQKVRKAFERLAQARAMAKGTNTADWNLVTLGVIQGKFASQIMGDWAQGEFAVAGKVAGKDYTCLPGLGIDPVLTTGGDAFYFPKVKDPAVQKAQLEFASVIVSKSTQVAFNTRKGSLPVRGDVDLGNVNDCMAKGLKLLDEGKVTSDKGQYLHPESMTEMGDLILQFWGDESMSIDTLQQKFVKVIKYAD